VIRIPVAQPTLGEEEARAVYETVRGGWVSMGTRVREFEERFASFAGARHAVAANNGTAALHLALIVAGVEEGDEVLVPDITFISTANVVMYERAKPVIVECDPDTYNIALDDAARRITERTKAIIPVDMNGLAVNYDEVNSFAETHGLAVVADSAESLGASYRGMPIGAQSSQHVFSFFPNKNLTTGEGGMITTDDDAIAKRLRVLRNQGQEGRYHHVALGYNYRMTDIQAAIGCAQLDRVESTVRDKQRVADRYTAAFEEHPLIRAPVLPPYVTQHSWYMYAVDLDDSVPRDRVVDALAEAGIDTRLSFPPIHMQPFYQERFAYTDQDYPISSHAWEQLLDIPIWPGLPEDQQDQVVESLGAIVERLAGAAGEP
jgi:perosamine synthetase